MKKGPPPIRANFTPPVFGRKESEVTTGSSDLDAILTGTPPEPEAAPETEPTGEVETPAVEPAATPPVAEKQAYEKPTPGHVPFQALADERRKRQELESRLAEMEKAQAPESKPNLFEDPDTWEKALDERMERKLQAVRQESEQKFLALVEQAAKARHTDFDEVAQIFAATARTTPGLIEEARNAPDPAEFIYQAGRNLKRFQEAGSIDALIAQAEARGAEKARQELQGKPAPRIPESLTDVTGSGDRAPQAFAPKPLSDLLPTY